MRTDIPIKKLIHTYVSNIFKLNSNDTNGIEQSELSQVQQCTEKAIYDSVREEILKDLTESEKEKMTQQVNSAVNKEKIKHLTSLLGEGGLLAFVIGLLVIQITNWLTFRICPQGYSMVIIILLLLAILGIFGFLLYQSISRLLNLGEENESK